MDVTQAAAGTVWSAILSHVRGDDKAKQLEEEHGDEGKSTL